jgi:transglutaminase-like putative cysteine protease
VAEFLFEKKTGWCEYFASAAVLLLRLQDLPARYVTGFSMDGATRVGDHWVVRESDAHAWVEVAVPGRGWIEVDPTPAGDYAAVHAAMNGGLSRYLDTVRAAFADLRMAIRLGDLLHLAPAIMRLVLSPVVVVPAAAAVLYLWRRRRRSRAPAPPPAPPGEVDPQVGALMARVDALWAACGHPRPHHRAPREHLDVTVHRLPAETQDPSRAVVECVYLARYAGERAPAAELDRLRRSLDAIGA